MNGHRIASVRGTPLRIPVDFSWLGVKKSRSASMCLVEVKTDTGIVGHGLTQHIDARAIIPQIALAEKAILGLDALANERAWHVLYWTLSGSAQAQYSSWAISAIDTALWDIKGKALELPVWKLLGGARNRVQAYATIGVPGASSEELVEAALRLKEMGFTSFKTQVGRPGLDHLKGQKPLRDIIREDAKRIKALRDALGDDAELGIDAQCRLDLMHALELVRLVEPYGVDYFEEPLVENDVLLMADMRRRCAMPLHAGQSEGLASRFRDMLINNAVDVLQPNIAVAGGFTQCARIAGLASAFNTPINGGNYFWHIAHLQAGVAAGTTVEYQTGAAKACEAIFSSLPQLNGDWLEMTDMPGLGFEPVPEFVREFTIT
ncbi:MAG: mandelate racemase/muconate lactonizing enzyme family protein [Beijerinckiaceae bacterium]|nr:mandelate racemase/muconate lactonizing enzyme family protein [Beijerinckiaceae bacterium]